MKRGFTLIELLVVVLIIGILAAVALPQYQKAVEKSRLTEVLQNIKILKECAELYRLEYGFSESETVYLEDLTCPVETPFLDWDGGFAYTEHFRYEGNCTQRACKIEIHQHPQDNYAFEYSWNNESSSKNCYTSNTDIGDYICKSLEPLGWKYREGEL